MPYMTRDFDPSLLPRFLDRLPVGVTVIDLGCRILYYNEFCADKLGRTPESLGRDIRLCHRKPESIARIDEMIEAFEKGRRESFQYDANPYGDPLAITLTPLLRDGRLVGYLHTVILKQP